MYILVAILKKMAAIKVKGQIWNGPMDKIYPHGMFSMQNFMLLSTIILPVSLTK